MQRMVIHVSAFLIDVIIAVSVLDYLEFLVPSGIEITPGTDLSCTSPDSEASNMICLGIKDDTTGFTFVMIHNYDHKDTYTINLNTFRNPTSPGTISDITCQMCGDFTCSTQFSKVLISQTY